MSLYTDGNEAVKSWGNGRLWLGKCDYILRETRPLAAFGSVYVTIKSREMRPLSHGITAAFGSVYRMELNGLIYLNITDEDNRLKIVHKYRQR